MAVHDLQSEFSLDYEKSMQVESGQFDEFRMAPNSVPYGQMDNFATSSEEELDILSGFSVESSESTDAPAYFNQPSDIEPTESTEVLDSSDQSGSELTEPTESTEVLDSSDQSGSESTEPTESTESSDSSDPSGTSESTEPTESTDSSDSSDPSGTSESTEPTESTESSDSSDPTGTSESTSEEYSDVTDHTAYEFFEKPEYSEDLVEPADVMAELIGQLADQDADTRKRASDQLRKLGIDALGPLVAASNGEDPQAKDEAQRLIDELIDKPFFDKLVDLLEDPNFGNSEQNEKMKELQQEMDKYKDPVNAQKRVDELNELENTPDLYLTQKQREGIAKQRDELQKQDGMNIETIFGLIDSYIETGEELLGNGPPAYTEDDLRERPPGETVKIDGHELAGRIR